MNTQLILLSIPFWLILGKLILITLGGVVIFALIGWGIRIPPRKDDNDLPNDYFEDDDY